MTAIIDNNLPLGLARQMDAGQSDVSVQHVVDFGLIRSVGLQRCLQIDPGISGILHVRRRSR